MLAGMQFYFFWQNCYSEVATDEPVFTNFGPKQYFQNLVWKHWVIWMLLFVEILYAIANRYMYIVSVAFVI